MNYFLVNWEIESADSRNMVLSFIKKAKNSDEAIIKSLDKIGGEHSVVNFTKEDLTKKSVYSNTGICYEAPLSLERVHELEVTKATCKDTGEAISVLVESNKKAQELERFFWCDGEPRYLASVKWTTYTNTGDIAAVHLFDTICRNSRVEEARHAILRVFIQCMEKDMLMSLEETSALLTGPNCVYKKGMDEYEVVKIDPLELRTIELDGVRQECFVPSTPNPEMPHKAILIRRNPHLK